AKLVAPAAVGAPRAHHPSEVEPEHDEPARRREVVADRPQQWVVLRPAVSRVGVAEDRAAAWLAIGRPHLTLQASGVVGGEGHGLHRSATIGACRSRCANPWPSRSATPTRGANSPG